MSRSCCGATIAMMLTVWAVCAADGTVTIGGVELPADCALAHREHPRLLFTKADLPRLRERLKHPRIATELEHAKQLAAENRGGAILLGVLYYLTGEPKYIEAAKAKLEPSWIQTYPLAADLVMGAMRPAEQQAEADRIVEIVKKERWRPHIVLDLAAWGHSHDEFLVHFLINKRGILAADTGAVHSLNNAALGFAGSQVHSDDLPHIRAYARQTIAHNSITVGSKPLELRARNNALLATVHGGGQSPIQDDSWWKSWDCPKPKTGDRPFREGRTIAYETSPLFDYAAGDATFATDGPTRGHIRVARAGKVVLDRPLAAEVEDSYEKWSEDPRYEAWMTRPEYRSFIGNQKNPETM